MSEETKVKESKLVNISYLPKGTKCFIFSVDGIVDAVVLNPMVDLTKNSVEYRLEYHCKNNRKNKEIVLHSKYVYEELDSIKEALSQMLIEKK